MTFLPSNRLLWLVAAVILPAILAGLFPDLAAVWLFLLAGVLLLALGDLAAGLRAAAPPPPSVPEIVRFSKDRAGAIPVTFAGRASPRARRVRFALGLPAVFDDTAPELTIDLPGGDAPARVDWGCTPTRRGRFSGVLACCETGSPLGLWRLRSRVPLPCELRVYPNLFTERKQLAALFLSQAQLGAKARRTIGRGREFEKLRDYLPGDGYDEIHWKATAKRGRPVTKIFQAERTQEIYVAIDLSRLSARELVHEGVVQTALERHLAAAMVLLLAAERQGDRFGLVAYDDRVRVFVRAGSGVSHYGACREAIHALQPGSGTPDMAEITRHLRANLRRRALLFFLADLDDPVLAEDFVRHGPLLSRQHLVMVNQLRAPGVAPLFTGGEAPDVDAVYTRLAGHLRWADSRALARVLKSLRITLTLMESETLAAQLVTQYFAIKQRQVL